MSEDAPHRTEIALRGIDRPEVVDRDQIRLQSLDATQLRRGDDFQIRPDPRQRRDRGQTIYAAVWMIGRYDQWP